MLDTLGVGRLLQQTVCNSGAHLSISVQAHNLKKCFPYIESVRYEQREARTSAMHMLNVYAYNVHCTCHVYICNMYKYMYIHV